MNIGIITVGDEILIGQVVDTNSAWIGKKTSNLGCNIVEILSVKDDYHAIQEALSRLVVRCNYVFITGGLGPTKDDITKKSIADWLGMKLIFHQETYDRIVELFKKFNRTLSDSHLHQCNMPEGATILLNNMGTAPGMLFHHHSTKIISMPGVPYEMQAIMQDHVLPMIESDLSPENKVYSRTIMTAGEGETYIEDKISGIIATFPEYISIAYLPSLGSVRLRVTGRGNDVKLEVDDFVNQISSTLGELVFGYDNDTMESYLQKLFISKGLWLGLAESCTGGYLSHKLTSLPGSSAYYKGGIVSYSNEIKMKSLGVNATTLENHGAVSEHTVIEMAKGALIALEVDVAISVSGIAGPDGGSPEKPVGTIWICIANKDHHHAFVIKSSKDRLKNIEYSANVALNGLRKFMSKYY